MLSSVSRSTDSQPKIQRPLKIADVSTLKSSHHWNSLKFLVQAQRYFTKDISEYRCVAGETDDPFLC